MRERDIVRRLIHRQVVIRSVDLVDDIVVESVSPVSYTHLAQKQPLI